MKKKIQLVIIVTLTLIYAAKSQELHESLLSEPGRYKRIYHDLEYNIEKYKVKGDEPNSAIDWKPFNILKYDLFLDWYDMLNAPGATGKDRQWTGINKITVRIDSSDIKSIGLDAVNLLIQSVKVNSVQLQTTPQPISGILQIPFTKSVNKGDTILIEISYKYVASNNNGFYLYPKHTYIGTLPAPFKDSVFTEERLAYTSTEPIAARNWMPCYDWPHDKAIATISTRVPFIFSVGSNGLLQKMENDGNAVIYTWHDDAPITTYLMSVTASVFREYSQWYHRVTNPKDSVEVKYYVWEKDYLGKKTDGSEYNAQNTLKTTPSMMEVFSKIFVEYPFKKYGIAIVQPFNFGGMEHQTLTTINRSWIRTNSQGGLAHELAHQWLGDLITCATWKDVWINEGGATWSEAVYFGGLTHDSLYLPNMISTRAVYLNYAGMKSPPIYDLPINTIFGSNAVLVYDKASWVYHMLKTMLGDSVYYRALRSMMARYAYKSLETEDFKNSFKIDAPNPQIDYDVFFDQWLHKGGHPIISTVTEISRIEGQLIATVKAQQLQPADSIIPEAFHIPLIYRFYRNTDVFSDTLIMTNRSQTFDFNIPWIPQSVDFDKYNVLCEFQNNVLSVRENTEHSTENPAAVYPNPVLQGAAGNIDYNFKKGGSVTIEIFNSLLEKVKTVYQGQLASGNYTFSFLHDDLPSGSYFLRIYNGSNSGVYHFSILK